MKRSLVLAILAALAVSLAGVAQAGPAEPPAPAKVAVPDGHKLFLVGHASGFQIHECTATGWRFVGPLANLYDDNGKLLMTHFGGPSWQARDGSKVTATLDGDGTITVDPTAIPWLRLRVTSAIAGADGDRLRATTYIQRLETTGGLAPAPGACNAGTVGQLAQIPYTAVYAFWKTTGN
jgi:predicted small lipoprotein YifL